MNQAKCTTCGAGLTIKQGDKTCVCAYCQSTNIVENALALGKVEVDVTEDIKKLRSNLTTFVQQNSIDEILRVSQKLLDWIPQDFVALYFFGYAKQQQNQPKFLYTFLETPFPHTIEEWQSVKLHLFEHSELRDKQRVLQFLKLVDQNATSDFLAIYDKRQVAEEHYANVPRDVFVCFSSWNQNIAHEVMEVVESDGYTCWISTRNLRPNDAENYWINIENAIEKASLFIVIGSEESMRSKDVQKEIELAIKHNKKRFEIKVDSAKQTSFFKFAFDGIKWLEYDSIQLSKLLKKRVFEEIQLNSTIKVIETVSKVEPKSTDQKKKQTNKFALLSLGFITVAAIGVFLLSQTVNQPSTTLDGTNTPIEEVQIQEDLESVGGEAIDTTPPTLTLIGDERVILSYGSEYIELGFNVEDDIDETVEVIVSGDIDSKSPGQYEILYTATDQSGNSTVATRFVIVEELEERIINVYAGGNNSYAVTNTNRVFAWGRNLHGTIGDGSFVNKSSPVEITERFLINQMNYLSVGIKQIEVNEEFVVVLLEDGRILHWGQAFIFDSNFQFPRTSSPTLLNLVDSNNNVYLFDEISVGNVNYPFGSRVRNFAGITIDNKLVANFGSRSDYINMIEHTENIRGGLNDKLIGVSISEATGYAITSNGDIYSWGANSLPKLTIEEPAPPVTFRHDQLPAVGKIDSAFGIINESELPVDIVSGQKFSIIKTSENRAIIFGYNTCGEVFIQERRQVQPTLINQRIFLRDDEIIENLSPGKDFVLITTSLNRVFAWGCNNNNQLGIGKDNNGVTVPNEITGLFDFKEDESILSVASGNSHSLLLTNQGRLFSWGSNTNGQLGTVDSSSSFFEFDDVKTIFNLNNID